MDKKYQVFVSSTFEDLIDHRKAVAEALLKAGALPVGMEIFPAADNQAWDVIRPIIDDSDYYVVIIGGKYGSTEPSTGTSYTEAEYDYAAGRNVPILTFIHKNPDQLPYHHNETDPAKRQRLAAFKEKAQKRLCRYWETKDQLTTEVLASYAQIMNTQERPGWVRGDKVRTGEDAKVLSDLNSQVAALKRENEQLKRNKALTGIAPSLSSQAEALYRKASVDWLVVKPMPGAMSLPLRQYFERIQNAIVKIGYAINSDTHQEIYVGVANTITKITIALAVTGKTAYVDRSDVEPLTKGGDNILSQLNAISKALKQVDL
jgi:hypothetical protein